MARKKPGLGRGLDALISAPESALPGESIQQIALDAIVPNPRQPRTHFDPEALAELAISIREHGVIQPLIVTGGDSPGSYTLIAGERRLQAAREAGLEAIPAIVREASDQELIELALIENVQRADLNPLETAEAYRQLSDEFALSQEEIADRVGKSRVAVTNTLRLLKLSPAVQQALADGQISEGHARALLGLTSDQAQAAALQTVVRRGLTVRQTEDLVRKLSGEKPEKKPKPAPSPEIKELEERLRARLGTRVSVDHRGQRGKLVIHYYSEEELNAIIDELLGEE